jgi:hypothetical protein
MLSSRLQLTQLPAGKTGSTKTSCCYGWPQALPYRGAPRVGKSSLAQRLLAVDGIPFLPTDVLRTVLRRVLPELDTIDQDPVDAWLLAEFMYPHIEQAAEVCVEEAACFLIEGFELSPSYLARLQAALAQAEVRGCFLGHASFSVEDLAGYRGPKPQHRGAARGAPRGRRLDPTAEQAAA